MAKFIAVFFALSLTAFAAKDDHRPTSCGPIDQAWNVKLTDSVSIPDAPKDKALIVFLNRTKIAAPERGGFKIGADGKWLADTKDKSFAYFTIEPGEHHLCGEVGKKFRAVMPLNAEAGKTYFIGNGTTAAYFGEPTIEEVNADQASVYMQRFKLAISQPKN